MSSRRVKIYFLLHSKAFLPSWKSVWEACEKNPLVDMKIIYCPVKKQGAGYSGQFDGTKEWLEENNIKYIYINRINLLFDRPDMLFIQTPYDNIHRKPKHYTENLRRWGHKLAYISYGLEFTEGKKNIADHFKRPIARNCDRIYAFCENLRYDYWKYGSISENRVKCFGHPKFDALYEARDIQMPQWLKDKANGRKIVCWHPHFPCNYSTADGKKVISTFPWEENLKVLEYIKQDKEHFYIFMAHHMFWGAFERDYGITAQEIAEVKATLMDGENSTIWTGEYPEVLAWSDIFLGERSAVTMEMVTTGKPVIYLENCPEVYNKFGLDVLESYYYAQNAEQAIAHLKDLKLGRDPKAFIRKEVFERYIQPYWDGKCGERIVDEVVNRGEYLKVPAGKLAFIYMKNSLKIVRDSIFSMKIQERINADHLVITFLGICVKIKLKKVVEGVN